MLERETTVGDIFFEMLVNASIVKVTRTTVAVVRAVRMRRRFMLFTPMSMADCPAVEKPACPVSKTLEVLNSSCISPSKRSCRILMTNAPSPPITNAMKMASGACATLNAGWIALKTQKVTANITQNASISCSIFLNLKSSFSAKKQKGSMSAR